jgi:hypothetical protein
MEHRCGYRNVRHCTEDQVLSFVAKTSCRAIQAADLLAFYSRRHANELLKASLMVDPGQMLKIIAENLPHRAFVAQRLRETARRHANLAIAASLARDAVNRARPAGPLSASAAWASPRRWP